MSFNTIAKPCLSEERMKSILPWETIFRNSVRLKSDLGDDVVKQLCPSCPQNGAARKDHEKSLAL